MKLRLRCLETKATLRMDLPNPCSLQQLQQALCISSPSSVHLSLNRKDELRASSPQVSLQSLGVTSGDLIYYSRDPCAFLSPSQNLGSTSSSVQETLVQDHSVQTSPRIGPSNVIEAEDSMNYQALHPKVAEQDSLVQESPQNQANDSSMQGHRSKEYNIAQENRVSGRNYPNQGTPDQYLSVQEKTEESDAAISSIQEEEATIEEDTETMDIDDALTETAGAKKFTEPYFLRRVLREELGDDGGEHKLLVIAVHAVLLESGFVGFDSVSGMRVDRFHLPDDWPSMARSISLWYTLPDLLGNGSNVTESVVFKFQSLGHFVNVYGSLAKGGSGLYRVCLDEYRFAPTIDLMWANCDKNDIMDDKDGSSKSYPENEVFEFWKMVKDGIALPLLIDLCDKTGLSLPPCLTLLPTELKLKILESLPGIDIARVGCACSEMRYLASNNDLWKQKFVEEFGSGTGGTQGVVQWKKRFTLCWEKRKKRKRYARTWKRLRIVDTPFVLAHRRELSPFGVPQVIGGDNDRLPGLGIPSPIAQPGHTFPRFHMLRNFSPHCNLGGFNA